MMHMNKMFIFSNLFYLRSVFRRVYYITVYYIMVRIKGILGEPHQAGNIYRLSERDQVAMRTALLDTVLSWGELVANGSRTRTPGGLFFKRLGAIMKE